MAAAGGNEFQGKLGVDLSVRTAERDGRSEMRFFDPADEIDTGDVAVEPLLHCLQSQQVFWGGGAGCVAFALPPEARCVVLPRQGGPFLHDKALGDTVTVDYAPR